MLTDGFCLLPYCCINAMRVHGHAREHALSADSEHGRGFLPVVDSGRGRGLGFLLAGMDTWTLYLRGFYPLPSLTSTNDDGPPSK